MLKVNGKKRGAQPGHKGTYRELLPPEHCDCGGAIQVNNNFQKHQVYEIPKPYYTVTEYQIFSGTCSCCNKKYAGQLPVGVTFKMFGAKTHALLAVLTSKYRLSKILAKKIARGTFFFTNQRWICI